MSDHKLADVPSLLPLYGKAALAAPLRRLPGFAGADTLPDSAYLLDDQAIDPAHLAAYQRVCGFSVSDVLPPTYLHLLAFPLSMALMGERAFPFPVIGLVHVENAIEVLRPVLAHEPVSLRVDSSDLRAHPAGTQFDVRAQATVGGEPAWNSRSTYLRRGAAPAGTEKPPREKRDAAPAPDGPATLVRVPGDIGRRYGAVSGDRNPIHLHPLTARLFGFASAIAHGMWLEARTLATLEGRLPDVFDVDVAFKTPVLLPSSVSIAASREPGGWALDVRDAKSGKPHLAGSVRGG